MQSIPVLSVELTSDIVNQKSSVIHLMSNASQNYLTNVETFFDDVMAHEQEMETDVLPDVALPHAKSSAVKTPFIVVGKYLDGIIWNNGKQVKLVIMIGAPEHANKAHLADDDFIATLLNSDTQSLADKVRGLYE